MISALPPSHPLLAVARLTEVEPSYIRDWLIVLACLIGLAIAILTLIEKLKGKSNPVVNLKNPLPVKWDKDVATTDQLDDLRRDVEGDIKLIRNDIAAGRETREREIAAIHQRIDKIVESVGAVPQIARNVETILRHHLGK